jgi:zinc transporter 1/2/3
LNAPVVSNAASPHTPLSHFSTSTLAQAIGIFILEFGILLHSILIGLMLAVTDSDSFRVLLVVLVFHRTFNITASRKLPLC